jgi:hypothetical protein
MFLHSPCGREQHFQRIDTNPFVRTRCSVLIVRVFGPGTQHLFQKRSVSFETTCDFQSFDFPYVSNLIVGAH